MPVKTNTLDELRAMALGAIRALIEDADTSEGSDYDVTATMASSVGLLNQLQARQLAEEIFPETASEEFVPRHAKRVGVVQQLAAKAVGKIQATASAGTSTQPTASALAHADGTAYATSEPGSMALPAWSGKTVAPDSAVGRVIVAPNTTGMAADDIVEIGGAQRAIREVLSTISAIDFYEPLPAAPAAGAAIEPVRGAVIDFIADEAGAQGNKEVGDELTLSAPATGVVETARIIECSGGGDDENAPELRARIIDHEAGRPGGGNVEHIRELARTTPRVRLADAVVFPCFRGLGTVDVIPIGLSGARVVGSAVTDAVLARLQAELPYHVDVSVLPATRTVSEYDVDVTVATEVGYERDFQHAGFAIAATPASETAKIYLTTDPTGTIEPGDRVLVQVKSGAAWKTLQRVVTSAQTTGGVSPHWIELDKALPIAPTSTDPQVLPGGPLAEPVIASLEAIFDGLGPSRKNTSPAWTWERHPLPSVAWDDTLRLAAIYESLMALDGVQNLPTIASPATDQQPGAQETIRRGKITVRFTES